MNTAGYWLLEYWILRVFSNEIFWASGSAPDRGAGHGARHRILIVHFARARLRARDRTAKRPHADAGAGAFDRRVRLPSVPPQPSAAGEGGSGDAGDKGSRASRRRARTARRLRSGAGTFTRLRQ